MHCASQCRSEEGLRICDLQIDKSEGPPDGLSQPDEIGPQRGARANAEAMECASRQTSRRLRGGG